MGNAVVPGAACSMSDLQDVEEFATGASWDDMVVGLPGGDEDIISESSDGNNCTRLLLTSSGVAHRQDFMRAFQSLLEGGCKGARGAKVLCIPDGLLALGGDVGHTYAWLKESLKPMGVSDVECVELRRTTPAMLQQKLQEVDCVYADMGNTFYLRYYMHKSGFDVLVPPLVRAGLLAFVGVSAGSIAAGHSISTAFWKGWDDPGRGAEWDLEDIGYGGLNLLPGGKSVFPHFAPHFEGLLRTRKRELGHEVVVLDEDHCYVVMGDEEAYIPSKC